MSTPPKSIKEYWAEPSHNRRHSSGRRESDYAVCPYHDGKVVQDGKDKEHLCAKIKEAKTYFEADIKEVKGEIDRMDTLIQRLGERIVGKWSFGIMVTVFLAMFTIFGGVNILMFNSIKTDLSKHIEEVTRTK